MVNIVFATVLKLFFYFLGVQTQAIAECKKEKIDLEKDI